MTDLMPGAWIERPKTRRNPTPAEQVHAAVMTGKHLVSAIEQLRQAEAGGLDFTDQHLTQLIENAEYRVAEWRRLLIGLKAYRRLSFGRRR
jgi:hypothetical protein